jgi:hypothetical protein
MEEVIRDPGNEEFVKSFREESKAIIIRRGGNKAGRFLEVAVYAVGGRRGLVMFPEGRGGRGWSRVSGELSKAQVFLEAVYGSQSSDTGGSIGGSVGGMGAVRRFGDGGAPSFAEMVRSAVPSTILSEKQVASTVSSSGLDFCPSGTPEKPPELRSAINCFEFELETAVIDSCAGVRPLDRDCGTRGSKRDLGWAFGPAVDLFFSELGRAFGRLKKAWLTVGLGVKPSLGPSGFKMPRPFKTMKPFKPRFLRPWKDILDPIKGAVAGRGGHRLSARRRKPAPATGSEPLDTTLKPASAPATGSEMGLGSATGSALDLTLMPAATGSEIAQFPDVGIGSSTLEASAPTVRDVGIGALTLEESVPTVSLPVSLPVHFYNCKHKVKRASNLDLGKLAGDLFSIAPGAVPLLGEQRSVSGGSSGLFSAFEPSGFAGSKEVSGLLAPAVEANKPLAHSSPAKGMLRRGFLLPRPCDGVPSRSPEPVSSSEVGESSERSNLLGEVFSQPWNTSEAGVEVEDGVSGANSFPEAVVDALAIAPFLGVSCGGNEQGFLDLMCDIEEGHKREGMFTDGGSVVKSKGWRERKNLECSLNFDIGSIGSSRVKNKSLRV